MLTQHDSLLAKQTSFETRVVRLAAARRELTMNKHGSGLIHNRVAGFASPKAKITIIKTNGQGLVVAAKLLKDRARNQLARARDHGILLCEPKGMVITHRISVQIAIDVRKVLVSMSKKASMLDQAVLKDQLGTNNANTWPHSLAKKFLDPRGLNDPGIVIEQDDIIALSL